MQQGDTGTADRNAYVIQVGSAQLGGAHLAESCRQLRSRVAVDRLAGAWEDLDGVAAAFEDLRGELAQLVRTRGRPPSNRRHSDSATTRSGDGSDDDTGNRPAARSRSGTERTTAC